MTPASTPLPRAETAAEIVAAAPTSCRGLLARAFAGEASPRSAIKAACLSCVGYDRADISGCTSMHCPLWRYRPYQGKGA